MQRRVVSALQTLRKTYLTKSMKTGIELIAAERERQITAEGWSAEHDDVHDTGELLDAGVCYAEAVQTNDKTLPIDWPWVAEWWKPTDDPVRNLVKAGALIAAEIDRLSRMNAESTRAGNKS